MDVWPLQTMPPKGELPCGRSFAASWIWEGHLIVHGERMWFGMQWRGATRASMQYNDIELKCRCDVPQAVRRMASHCQAHTSQAGLLKTRDDG